MSSCKSSGKKDVNEENEEEENDKRCKNCASENTFGFDYCFKCRQERKEFDDLVALLKGSEDLPSLEKNYKTVKKSPLYSSSKNTFVENENNKKRLDNFYVKRVINLKLKNSNTSHPNDPSHFKDGL
nr:7937_t:CDS:2 [Entrophospora candida]